MKRRYLAVIVLALFAGAFIFCEDDKPNTIEDAVLKDIKVSLVTVRIKGIVSCAACTGGSMLVDVLDQTAGGYNSLLNWGKLYDSVGNFEVEVKSEAEHELTVKVYLTSEGGTLLTREAKITVPANVSEASFELTFTDS